MTNHYCQHCGKPFEIDVTKSNPIGAMVYLPCGCAPATPPAVQVVEKSVQHQIDRLCLDKVDVVVPPQAVSVFAEWYIEKTKSLREQNEALSSIADGVLTCLKYPRGSEAQVRCLEEVGQMVKAQSQGIRPVSVEFRNMYQKYLDKENEREQLQIRIDELVKEIKEEKQYSSIKNDTANTFMKQVKELQQEIAAIQTGIRSEFKTGEPSGDVLQDFATFIEHHNECEKQITALREAIRVKDKTLCFFSSVIKCEESWTSQCEDEFNKSLNQKGE